ncbi:MAG: amino acid ABC transporter permease [Hyphomicrobiales bacterium]
MDKIIYAMPFLWKGLLVTIVVSALTVAFSLALGVLLGLTLHFRGKAIGWAIRVFSDVVRGIPILILLFSIYYLLPVISIDVSPFWSGVCALTIFKTAHTIEITRGALQAVPLGQHDAGKAIGLTFWQRFLYIVYPLSVRGFLPPWINSVTDAVKGSALVSLLGVVDLMLAVQQVIGRTYEPMPLYMIGAGLYFAINYSLSLLSRSLEARFAYIRQ